MSLRDVAEPHRGPGCSWWSCAPFSRGPQGRVVSRLESLLMLAFMSPDVSMQNLSVVEEGHGKQWESLPVPTQLDLWPACSVQASKACPGTAPGHILVSDTGDWWNWPLMQR